MRTRRSYNRKQRTPDWNETEMTSPRYVFNKPDTMNPGHHIHTISEITGLQTILTLKQNMFTPSVHIDKVSVAAPVTLNLLSLVSVSLELNNINNRYNTLAQKFNTLIDTLETQNILKK